MATDGDLENDGNTGDIDQSGETGDRETADDEYVDAPWWKRQSQLIAPFAVMFFVIAGFAVWWLWPSSSSPTPGPEGVPIANVADLASAHSTIQGAAVDGITCSSGSAEVVTWHIHSYLSIYVNGEEERLPAGVGITRPQLLERESTGLFIDNSPTGDCLYWLHTHANDGIIHTEAPNKGNFTLGQFFDIWNQPLSPHQVGPAKGNVAAFENGTRYQGDPRDVPLLPHAVIQLDVGTPVVPFQSFNYKVTGSCGADRLGCSLNDQ